MERRDQQAQDYLALLLPQHLPHAQELAFKSELLRIRFDYTLASLSAIDEMLLRLRGLIKVDYPTFLAQQAAVNFVAALNFYIGATMARAGHFALRWIDYAEASRHMPGIPMRFETDLGCIVGDSVYFPANVVTEMLFDPDMGRSCTSFAQKAIDRLTLPGQRLPD